MAPPDTKLRDDNCRFLSVSPATAARSGRFRLVAVVLLAYTLLGVLASRAHCVMVYAHPLHGQDRDKCGLTPEQPCRTLFASFLSLQDGDDLLLSEGLYADDKDVNLVFNKTNVTIRPVPLGAKVVLDLKRRGRLLDVVNASQVTLSGLTVWNGSNSQGGGCIRIRNASDVYLESCDFVGCESPGGRGGALLAHDSMVLLSDCRFADARADIGGAACVTGSAFVDFESCVFENTTADEAGGAAASLSRGGQLTAVHSRFLGSRSLGEGGGGAVLTGDASTTVVQGSLFEGTSAEGNGSGGALRSTGSSATLVFGGQSFGSTASLRGGFVSADESAVVEVRGSGVFSSRAGREGGGFCADQGATLRVLGGSVDGGMAAAGGGAAALGEALVLMEGIAVRRCQAARVGGGYLHGSARARTTLLDVSFEGNAAREGSALHVAAGTGEGGEGREGGPMVEARGATFEDNAAAGEGTVFVSGPGAAEGNRIGCGHLRREVLRLESSAFGQNGGAAGVFWDASPSAIRDLPCLPADLIGASRGGGEGEGPCFASTSPQMARVAAAGHDAAGIHPGAPADLLVTLLDALGQHCPLRWNASLPDRAEAEIDSPDGLSRFQGGASLGVSLRGGRALVSGATLLAPPASSVQVRVRVASPPLEWTAAVEVSSCPRGSLFDEKAASCLRACQLGDYNRVVEQECSGRWRRRRRAVKVLNATAPCAEGDGVGPPRRSRDASSGHCWYASWEDPVAVAAGSCCAIAAAAHLASGWWLMHRRRRRRRTPASRLPARALALGNALLVLGALVSSAGRPSPRKCAWASLALGLGFAAQQGSLLWANHRVAIVAGNASLGRRRGAALCGILPAGFALAAAAGSACLLAAAIVETSRPRTQREGERCSIGPAAGCLAAMQASLSAAAALASLRAGWGMRVPAAFASLTLASIAAAALSVALDYFVLSANGVPPRARLASRASGALLCSACAAPAALVSPPRDTEDAKEDAKAAPFGEDDVFFTAGSNDEGKGGDDDEEHGGQKLRPKVPNLLASAQVELAACGTTTAPS